MNRKALERTVAVLCIFAQMGIALMHQKNANPLWQDDAVPARVPIPIPDQDPLPPAVEMVPTEVNSATTQTWVSKAVSPSYSWAGPGGAA